jgi:hypothetical protein
MALLLEAHQAHQFLGNDNDGSTSNVMITNTPGGNRSLPKKNTTNPSSASTHTSSFVPLQLGDDGKIDADRSPTSGETNQAKTFSRELKSIVTSAGVSVEDILKPHPRTEGVVIIKNNIDNLVYQSMNLNERGAMIVRYLRGFAKIGKPPSQQPSSQPKPEKKKRGNTDRSSGNDSGQRSHDNRDGKRNRSNESGERYDQSPKDGHRKQSRNNHRNNNRNNGYESDQEDYNYDNSRRNDYAGGGRSNDPYAGEGGWVWQDPRDFDDYSDYPPNHFYQNQSKGDGKGADAQPDMQASNPLKGGQGGGNSYQHAGRRQQHNQGTDNYDRQSYRPRPSPGKGKGKGKGKGRSGYSNDFRR